MDWRLYISVPSKGAGQLLIFSAELTDLSIVDWYQTNF